MKYNWLHKGPILSIVLIVLGALTYSYFALGAKDYRVGDLGLGIATTTKTEYWHSLAINEMEGGYKKIVPAILKAKTENKKTCLLLGNSQLHAINDQQVTDHLAVYHLNQLAERDSLPLRFFQLTSPNVNFQELLLYYLTLKKEDLLPDWIVVGCPYRTFQLTGLRKDFEAQLLALPVETLGLSNNVLAYYKEQKRLLLTTEDIETERGTLQENLEKGITVFIERYWEAYRYRGNLRSKIKVMPGTLYRSLVEQQTFYSGSESTEEMNMSFLMQLMDLCETDKVSMLIYQPPHAQSDDRFQYSAQRYKTRFDKIERISRARNQVYFRCYEKIIPLKNWGLDNAGRLDVFHFKGEGHRLLADSVYFFFETENAH